MVVDDPDARAAGGRPSIVAPDLSDLRASPSAAPHTRPHATIAALTALALALALAACGGGSGVRPGGARTGASAALTHVVSAPARHPALLQASRPTGRAVSVAVAPTPAGAAAPADFLGLSFEQRSLPLLARYATRGDLVALLRSLGSGVLRFGGASADEQVAWAQTPGAALPPWATTAITARDLAGIAALARASGWRVLLSVNLAHYDPTAAAQEASAAHAALGSALAGIELGNEPDSYTGKHLRGAHWSFAAYRAQAAAYRAAIATAAPGVAIAAPDPATGVPGLAWLRAAARTLHPELLTDHYYPLSSCGYRPTLGELLSPNVRRAEREMLSRVAAIAHAANTPARIDETNSISCEGRPGVSDTFASALWALDYGAHAMTAGLAGVNFHDLLSKPGAYSPLLAPGPAALAAGALRARPEWYALLAARQLRGGRPLRASVAGAAPGELDASAFRAPDGTLRLVLVDYDPPGARPLAVRLRVPRMPAGAMLSEQGSVLRLTGPAPAATSGVELGGRAVAANGTWTPPRALPAVYAHGGSLSLQMPPSSAAVVTLYPGPGPG